MRTPLPLLVGIMTATFAGPARASDAPTALDELKEGYALKQAGKCREALPHFARSLRLDRKPKAVLNLADCEAQIGDLVAARGHAAEGRQLAREQNDPELAGFADQQFVAIEKRLPQLTIRLAPDAPSSSKLALDGRPLDPSSIGIALPVNPGAHSVVVSAPGRSSHKTTAQLAEAMTQTLEVAPGDHIEPPETGGERDEAGAFEHLDSRRLLAIGVGGVGLIGLAVGVGAGIAAGSTHGVLEYECGGNNCPPPARDDLDRFHSLKTASTVFYVIGFAGVAGGTTLWLTAPKAPPDAPRARLLIGPAAAGIVGTF